jgi:GNAT superfamily N-acetyltransferase
MSLEDQIAVCAAGESAWHAAAYTGLGAEWREEPGFAWGPSGPPHRFLLAAVTLDPDCPPPRDVLEKRSGVLRDSWARYTPDDMRGWIGVPSDPWMIRDPGPCATFSIDGVEVKPTNDELLFEHVAFTAAGGSPPVDPGELHPEGSSRYEGMHMFLAWRNGIAVGTAIAVEHSTGVVISGVGVVEKARRKGIGALLTATAVCVDTAHPSTLTASKMGIGVYRELGFVQVGVPVHWAQSGSGRPPHP